MDKFQESKKRIGDFWNEHPCGDKFSKATIGTKEYFESIKKIRFQLEPHILEIIDFDGYRNKRVLEVGCGLGTDGAQFAENGAEYFAIDLAPRHIELAKKQFELFNLEGNFQVADAENLPFGDNTFDLVYSQGVLHHTPNTQKAVDEIYRVLKCEGRTIVMLYHKNSYNYYINIMVIRRIGIFLLYFPWGIKLINRITGENLQRLLEHKRNLIREGLKYLSTQRFLTQNTDGPGNPLSKVYTKKEAMSYFGKFRNTRVDIKYLNRRWVPLIGRYIPYSIEKKVSRLIGWHLYVFAIK